jgi:hypothetical protein
MSRPECLVLVWYTLCLKDFSNRIDVVYQNTKIPNLGGPRAPNELNELIELNELMKLKNISSEIAILVQKCMMSRAEWLR